MAQLDTGTDSRKIIRASIRVTGIIQGVGFRPFIYRIAREHSLTGFVANTAAGVTIEADGPEQEIDGFVRAITSEKPPLATVDDLQADKSTIEPETRHESFEIIASISAGRRVGPITPDTDVCDNCLAELHDPANRRYLYPFINCTDCGPRYTLIEKTPYDRPYTAMKHFPMCDECHAEYIDPLDRRFHAQATCCPACGPSVTLTDSKGQAMASGDPIRTAADLLASGKVVAIKGIGGFHLAADAANRAAVAALRERKGRPDKPLAVMADDLEKIKAFAHISHEDQKWLTDRSKPIVLLPKRSPFMLAENVAPANRFVGTMLTYTPIHHLLFRDHDFQALVMTSGNLSGSPVVKDNDDAFRKLADIADYLLLHDRPIVTQADDSVVRTDSTGYKAIYRRARAHVPIAVNLKRNSGRTLALGAIIKNTICITKENEAFLSQHIGDLDNIDTQVHQENITDHFRSLMRVDPDLLVHDLHPDYPGTRFACSQKELPTIGVQHHHAHAVSCMAEHGLEGPVIGLTLDGNGYGPDNSVWGGEVLLADYHDFQRLAHLAVAEMPGGDAAVREPWRMAVSHLYRAYGPEFKKLDLQILKELSSKLAVIEQMIEKSINSPLTSSCGRLFDTAAALLGLRHAVSYEGQAAAELEMLLEPENKDGSTYPFEIIKNTDRPWLLPVKPIIRGLVDDILEKTPPPLASRRFHNTLAGLFTRVCREARNKTDINKVVLSGGVFQNLNLLNQIRAGLESLSFKVYAHNQVPPNDGGLSLGQAVAGRAMWEKKQDSRGRGGEGSRVKKY